MIRTEVLHQKFSHTTNYIEVWGAFSATHVAPNEVANYVWTFALLRSPDAIPRKENGKQIFPESSSTLK